MGVFLGLGLVFLGVGVFSGKGEGGEVVEVVKEEDEDGKVYVDVSGAVEKPGVYELDKGARVGEALTMAGGLAGEADRGWVGQFVNLAEEVEDGGKIYIPKVGRVLGEDGRGGEAEGAVAVDGGRVNVNTASESELESLWGIGEVRAGKIIENRPYGSVEEWKEKAEIPENVYERVKDEVSVW